MEMIKKLMIIAVVTNSLIPLLSICAAESNDIPEEKREATGTIMNVEEANKLLTRLIDELLTNNIIKKNIANVNVLLDKGANINNIDEVGFTPLYHAIITGDTTMVNLLLDRKADINQVIRIDRVPLFLAVHTEHSVIVNILINKKANINITDREGNTPLSNAILLEKNAIVNMLIDKGADINKANKEGTTPLLRAIIKEDVKLIKILLCAGAQYNLRPDFIVPDEINRLILATIAINENLEQQDWDETDLSNELKICTHVSDIHNLIGEYAKPHYYNEIFSIWLEGDKNIHTIIQEYVGNTGDANQAFSEAITHHHQMIQELANTVTERQQTRNARTTVTTATLTIAKNQVL